MWDIIRYITFGFFLLVLLPYSVMALWGIGAWTKAIATGEEPNLGEDEETVGEAAPPV